MGLSLNNASPIYRQIVDYFEKEIIEGELPPGTSLPSERDLALELNVNRSTIATAYSELRASGLIYSKQGSGTRVNEYLWDIVPKKLLNWNHFRNKRFSPNKPLVNRILEASKNPDIISFAKVELSNETFPTALSKEVFNRLNPGYWLSQSTTESDNITRTALAKHLTNDWGTKVDKDNILLTSCIHQSFLLLTHCMLNHGDTVAIENPSYTYAVDIFTSAGIQIVRLPIDENGLNPEEIPNLYKKHRIKMVFTNPTYQNPTGTVLTLERRKRLLDICNSYKIPIVEIDCASPLAHNEGAKIPPSLYELDNKGIVINIGSFSDTISPTIDFGWVLASKYVLGLLWDGKYQLGLGSAILTNQFITEFLNNGFWATNLENLKKTIRNRKLQLVNSLDNFLKNQLTYYDPKGGYNVWCHISKPISREKELLESCIHHGVLPVPGSVYGVSPGYLRLSFAQNSGDLVDIGLQRLSSVLE